MAKRATIRPRTAYSPEVLRAINDPRQAPKIAALISDYMRRRDGGMAAIGETPSEIRIPSLPSTSPARDRGGA